MKIIMRVIFLSLFLTLFVASCTSDRDAGIIINTASSIYVADYSNNRIVKMDNMTGSSWITYGTYGNGTSQFDGPMDIFVDSNRKIYVADTYNNRIVRMDDMSGSGWITFGSAGSALALDNFLLPGNKEDGSDKSRHWNVFGGICLYKSPPEALDLALKREMQDLRDDKYSEAAMREFFRDMIANVNGMYHVLSVNPDLLLK